MANYHTIEGFEQLSKQQLFDMAAAHVLKNGRPSRAITGVCTYGGIGCAAAPFLKPESREALHGSWSTLIELGSVPAHEGQFVQELQCCHDTAHRDVLFISDFQHKMLYLADEYGLSASVFF